MSSVVAALSNALSARSVENASSCSRPSPTPSSGDDFLTCRVASGMQASCSPLGDGLSKSSLHRHSGKGCRYADSGIFTSSRFVGGSHLGFPPLQAACSGRTPAPLVVLGIGSLGMRYSGRKGVFKTRGQQGDGGGSPSHHLKRGKTRGLSQGNEARSIIARSPSEEAPGGLQTIQCSMTKAFSSMVLMLKTLQTYALEMRSMLLYEDFQSVAHVIHREMQASLLWLFQQVFACTPMLMVAVMVLFSDFTAHSSSSLTEVELLPATVSTPSSTRVPLTLAEILATPVPFRTSIMAEDVAGSVAPLGGDCGGRGGRPKYIVTPEDDGEGLRNGSSEKRQLTSAGSGVQDLLDNVCHLEGDSAAEASFASRLSQLKSQAMMEAVSTVSRVQLGEETTKHMVSPVSVTLEEDDYVCFHRTELEYRHALEEDPANPLLLANYAQFLYTVRHDLDRSEAYFHRALRIDPSDGEILGRFATFLWLGRKDKSAADRAFKAAIASSPDNPYFSGSYAHFLWHGGDDETSCPVLG